MVQNTDLKAAVSKVKEDNHLKETATTYGPQGKVSQKTQQSVQLLLREVNRLLENINTINPEFAKHIDWSTLLTTIVENLHAVSYFKHETFSALQYAMDYGTISKESLDDLKCKRRPLKRLIFNRQIDPPPH